MKRTADELEKDVQNVGAEEAVNRKESTDSVGFWRCQIEAVYRRRNPHKLKNIQALLEKHVGREAVLYAKVCKTYDLDPGKFYTSPQAWEQYETDVKPEEPGHEAPAETGSGVSVPSLFGIPSFDKKQDTNGKGQDESDEEEQRPEPEPPQKAEGECKTQ
ncbi:unnamed protein product [Durusdinium trenchii]|uniref:Uncharacterized protein n=2 Tax=Durusdinium trenchii TaxID=1381693 RepID=A0ABP0SKJ8_9DINO